MTGVRIVTVNVSHCPPVPVPLKFEHSPVVCPHQMCLVQPWLMPHPPRLVTIV